MSIASRKRCGTTSGKCGATNPTNNTQGLSSGALARSAADAPEIDGVVHVEPHPSLKVGEFAQVKIRACDDYDLFGKVSARKNSGSRPGRSD